MKLINIGSVTEDLGVGKKEVNSSVPGSRSVDLLQDKEGKRNVLGACPIGTSQGFLCAKFQSPKHTAQFLFACKKQQPWRCVEFQVLYFVFSA
jgi:hypothetical protein